MALQLRFISRFGQSGGIQVTLLTPFEKFFTADDDAAHPQDARSFRWFGWEDNATARGTKTYWTQTDPDCVSGFSVNHSKELAGTTGLEPAASAVTGQQYDVTD